MDSPGRSNVSASASILTQRPQHVYHRFLRDAAAGLIFSPELGVHSYNHADFSQLFTPTGVLKPAARRRLYRPAPKLKHREAAPESQLPPLVDHSSAHRRLQESYSRTHMTEVKPVHKTLKNQLLLNDLKSHRNQQWQIPDLVPGTMTTDTYKKCVTPSKDLNEDQNQVQITQPQTGPDILSWAAAQYLDLDSDCRGVIERLLEQHFHSQDVQPEDEDELPSSENQSPASLLVSLSSQTTLVRFLLSEHLNRPGWRNRLLTCNTLSSIKGPVNKDVVHKLIHLMWNDQSDQVRLAAAETLMKLGKVQDVQNQIRWKLEGEVGQQGKMQALDLISSLQLVTVKLLDSFGSCFRDEFTSVRKQACVTAASLRLTDDTVVSRLLELVDNDPAREVRLSALTAVGALGLSSADVQETLLRCAEVDEDAALRLAACRLLWDVGVPKTKLQDFLLRRVVAEPSRLVRRAIKEIMLQCDFSLQENHCDTSISLQVKHHCDYRVITDKVLLLEKLQGQRQHGRCLRPRTLVWLLSQRYSTVYSQVTDQHSSYTSD